MSGLTERRLRAEAYLQALAWLESIPHDHRPGAQSPSLGEAARRVPDAASLSITLARSASPGVRSQFESLVAQLHAQPRGGRLDPTQKSLIVELATTMADEIEAALGPS